MGELIDKMRERAAMPAPEPRRATFGLTARELEIVSTVVDGYANADIAQKYSITVKTVTHHLNIFDKLGVANRLELARFAVHHRLESALHHKYPALRAGRRPWHRARARDGWCASNGRAA